MKITKPFAPPRHLHSNSSSECTWFRLVPSQVIPLRGSLLDEWLDGDDNSQCTRSSPALRLGHFQVPTSTSHYRSIPWHDVKQYFLGEAERSLRKEASKLKWRYLQVTTDNWLNFSLGFIPLWSPTLPIRSPVRSCPIIWLAVTPPGTGGLRYRMRPSVGHSVCRIPSD